MNRTLTGLTLATFALAGLLSVGLIDAQAEDHGDQAEAKAGCTRGRKSCGNADKPKGTCNKARKADCDKAKSCDKDKATCCTKDGSCGGRPAKAVQTAIAELDAAEAALKAGQTEKAHAAIQAARKRLAAAHAKMGTKGHHKRGSCDKARKGACQKSGQQASRPAVINTKCPIMGNKIDPAKVPANLYREYHGKGVGFCCGGCPVAWDKLSDEQKQAKLSAVSG